MSSLKYDIFVILSRTIKIIFEFTYKILLDGKILI